MSEYNNQQNQEPFMDVQSNMPVVEKKGFSIASLVLGITAIVPGCCCTYLGIILGILAIVFGILFLKANNNIAPGRSFAIAGLVLGIIALVLGVILTIIGLAAASNNWYDYNYYLEKFME